MSHLGISARRGWTAQVDVDVMRATNEVTVGIEAAHREVAIVEIHTHDRRVRIPVSVEARRADCFGRRWRTCPGCGEVPTGSSGSAGDGVGHRFSAGDPGQPLAGPIREPRGNGQDIAAVFGVGQVLQRLGQAG